MQKLEGAPDVKHMRGTNTTVLTVSLTHVLHTQENRPSEQLPRSNDTVKPNISRPSIFTAHWNIYFYLRSLKRIEKTAFTIAERFFKTSLKSEFILRVSFIANGIFPCMEKTVAKS